MSEFVKNIRFLAAGQDDPQSVALSECADRIEELEKQFEELLVQNNRLEDFVTKDCVLRTEARLQIEKLKKEIMDVLEGRHG